MTKTALLLTAGLAFCTTASWAQEDMEALLDGKASATTTLTKNEAAGVVRALQYSLGKLDSKQMPLVQNLEQGKWSEALIEFGPGLKGTSFESTANYFALKGLLEFKSGLPFSGIETLFTVSEPEKIDREIMRQWIETAPVSNEAWTFAEITWKPQWSKVLPPEHEVKIRSARIDKQADIATLRELAVLAPEGSQVRAAMQWKLVIALGLSDQADEGAKILAGLMKLKNPPVPMDLMNLTAARLLYQKGFYDAAIKYQEKIQKGSDWWTEAQEEMAWSSIRKGLPNNAIAITQTLIQNPINVEVSSEAYFVRSLAQLKVCDYSQVVQTLNLVSPVFKKRTVGLEKLAQNAQSNDVNELLTRMQTQQGKIRGTFLQSLPRQIERDERLQQLVHGETLLKNESEQAEKVFAKSLALTGLQGAFELQKKTIDERLKRAHSASLSRIQDMARKEVAQTQKMLQKMHIVEAEILQQESIADRIVKNSSKEVSTIKGTTGSKSVSALKFPAEKEIWFDEMSNYKVDVRKNCQAVTK